MPSYRNRRKYPRRRSKYLSKSYVKSKRSNKSQASQILSLQRQIKSINRKVGDRTQYTQWQKANFQPEIGHVLAPSSSWQPAVYIPTTPNTWTPIFQSDQRADENYGNKFRGRSMGFEHMIQINTDAAVPQDGDPVTCTLMCLSLRKETALQVIQATNNLTDFTQGNRSYVLSTMGAQQGSGMCMINKAYFKVRYVNRFMLGANTDFAISAKTTNLKDNNKRIYHKLNYPNVIKSGRGDVQWAQMTAEDLEPTDHIIWLLFHNAYGTQFLTWSTNTVITGRETN